MSYFYDQLEQFVASELSELESRDVDTLYVCIKENVEEGLKRKLNSDEREELYAIISSQLEALK